MLTRPCYTGPMATATSPDALRQLLRDPDTFATTLLVLFVDRYGMEAMEWHPRAIAAQLADDFGVAVPAFTLDKLMAAITVLTTDYFYKNLSRFIDLCNVLSGDSF